MSAERHRHACIVCGRGKCPSCRRDLFTREQVGELVRAAVHARGVLRQHGYVTSELDAALKPFPDPEPEGEAG